ncbi:hypothetical protein Fcan01_22986 [Folsomia candida]|uniref:Uncharacterized protein n=1 Tax=Folsomia candida TaxID=158441 RepID=A0A226DB97_FOLCA|nr:hypothetical protein Fcan01_22986 [Folsomia candida]
MKKATSTSSCSHRENRITWEDMVGNFGGDSEISSSTNNSNNSTTTMALPSSQSFDFGTSQADFLKFLSASLQQQQQNSQDSVPALYQDEPVYKHPQFWRDVTPFGKIQIRQFWDPLDFAYYAIIRKINRNEKIGNLPDSLIRIPVKDIADVVSRMRELFTEIDSTNVRDEIPSLKGNPYAAIEDRNDDNF